jgi:hypothetical protein
MSGRFASRPRCFSRQFLKPWREDGRKKEGKKNYIKRKLRQPRPVQVCALETALAEGETRAAPDDVWDRLTDLSGPPSIADPDISRLTALDIPAVRAAVKLIAGTTAAAGANELR